MKDKSLLIGQSRNPSVCANSPHVSKGSILPDMQCAGVGQGTHPNGTRKRKVAKGSVWPRSVNKGWRPHGYLPVRIKLP